MAENFKKIPESDSCHFHHNDLKLHYLDDLAIYVLNLRQLNNEKAVRKERNLELYQWAKLFQAESWEELCMLSEKNEIIDECVYTMAQLTEDEKIRMQCEARQDNLAIELGIRRRGEREGLAKGLAEGEWQKAREIAKKLLSMHDKHTIAEITGLSLEEIKALEKETV